MVTSLGVTTHDLVPSPHSPRAWARDKQEKRPHFTGGGCRVRRLDKWLGIYQEGTEKILIQISQHVTEHFSSTWVHPPAASPWKRRQDPQGKSLPLEDMQVLSMRKPTGRPYSWTGRDHFDFHPTGTAHKPAPLKLWGFIHLYSLYSFHSSQSRNQFKKSLQAPLTVLPGNLPPDLMRKDNNLSQILDAYHVPEMHQKLSNIQDK